VAATPVEIAGPAGALEGAIEGDASAAAGVAVICHPHPLEQGTMDNKVVTTLARAFVRLGAVALRFNFRGVGESAGRHDDGIGERDDALAVIAFCRARWPSRRLYLGGFSFGAAVALVVASRAAPHGLITVAPPIERLPEDFLAPSCPWVLVHGTADDVVPLPPVLAWSRTLVVPPRVVLVEGGGHFFHGRLPALIEAVTTTFGADFGV
jgi:hypothetical protein